MLCTIRYPESPAAAQCLGEWGLKGCQQQCAAAAAQALEAAVAGDQQASDAQTAAANHVHGLIVDQPFWQQVAGLLGRSVTVLTTSGRTRIIWSSSSGGSDGYSACDDVATDGPKRVGRTCVHLLGCHKQCVCCQQLLADTEKPQSASHRKLAGISSAFLLTYLHGLGTTQALRRETGRSSTAHGGSYMLDAVMPAV
jgi:hypothetical protein